MDIKKYRLITCITLTIIAIIILCVTGCNKEVFDTTYTFNKIVCNYNGDEFELKIKSWKDYDGEQLQIKTYDGNVYLLSANNCYMVGDE